MRTSPDRRRAQDSSTGPTSALELDGKGCCLTPGVPSRRTALNGYPVPKYIPRLKGGDTSQRPLAQTHKPAAAGLETAPPQPELRRRNAFSAGNAMSFWSCSATRGRPLSTWRHGTRVQESGQVATALSPNSSFRLLMSATRHFKGDPLAPAITSATCADSESR